MVNPYLVGAFLAFSFMEKRWFWHFIFTTVLGWSVQGTMPDVDKCVVACYPHTHAWDLFYGLFLIKSNPQESKIMMKASLVWMKFLGLPVQAVSRNNNSGQSGALAKAFSSVKTRWLWVWISGTRAKSEHVSSGFYYIAKEGGVPIVFGGIDYRKKQMIPSKPYDPNKYTKDEILEEYQRFAKKFGTHPLYRSAPYIRSAH